MFLSKKLAKVFHGLKKIKIYHYCHLKIGYCTLPPPPPTPPISQESLNLTPESSESRESADIGSFLNSTAETTLTPSQKMTLPRPTMGVAATCLRRLPLED